jgi:hypothetical protein
MDAADERDRQDALAAGMGGSSGNFAAREEAEARGAELGRLGLLNHVVRAK